MKTTNVFLIFLDLKRQEIGAYFRSEWGFWAYCAIAILVIWGGPAILALNPTAVWLLFIAFYLIFLMTTILGLCLLFAIWLMVRATYKFLASNWRKAKQISAERKRDEQQGAT